MIAFNDKKILYITFQYLKKLRILFYILFSEHSRR